MMRKAIILLSMLAGGFTCQADVKFVNFNKLDPDGKLATEQKFLLDNLGYFDHWTPGWPYDVSKDSLVAGLKNCLRHFEPLRTDEFERDLLLGEVAHYLYNLSEETYYDTAERWYLKAIRVNDKDCRGYWFLGYAYATSDRIAQGIDCFQKALRLVTKETGVDFWQEYAFAMDIGNMPFHARWALTRYLQSGGVSLLSQIMDSTLRANLRQADPGIKYSPKALWASSERQKEVTFTSYPFGLRFTVDSNWRISIGNFDNRKAGVIIKPPIAVSAKGTSIGYSIGLEIKVPEEGEKLEDFVAALSGGIPGKQDSVFRFAADFTRGVSYSYSGDKFYADRGGARVWYFAVERDFPADPGLALEDVSGAAKTMGDTDKLSVYRMGSVRTRFPGRVFYFFILDTCGDIQQESRATFQRWVDHIILE